MSKQNVYFETNKEIPQGARQNYSGSISIPSGKVAVSSIISNGPIPSQWPATSAQLNPAQDGAKVTLYLPDGSTKTLSGGSTPLNSVDLNHTYIEVSK